MRLLPDNTLLITIQDWMSAGLSYNIYEHTRKRCPDLQVTRACKGKPVEIYFDTIPEQYRSVIQSKLGDPRRNAIHRSFRDLVQVDHEALAYFSHYKLADGRNLSQAHIREYSINANVLNAVGEMFKTQSTTRKALGGSMKGFWTRALNAVDLVRAELEHTLPSNETALKRKYQRYKEMGYEGLVSGRFCNDNSRKVSQDIERLIMSLYTMPNKPFAADVHSLYMQFLEGKITVADRKTGEMFMPESFHKDGKPIEISESTVWNYLNQPHNRVIVDKLRSGSFQFNNLRRPHHNRHAPIYAFSKISMDDRDLTRKMADGSKVKVYYAYDVASECIIGYAFSRRKDERLVLDCFMNMFRLIENEGFGMPLEVEVENHLMNRFKDELHLMFPFVRWCNPGNSQEKSAEHKNRKLKYGIEKKNGRTNGRWHAKHEAYREDVPKSNDEYKFKAFTYEQIVADHIDDINEYNNAPHPRQKKYPGMSRWDVLKSNMNPKVASMNKAVLYKCIGYRTSTSIQRSQYCTVQHTKFTLPDPYVLSKLLPGNYKVEAYYLPDNEGRVNEIFLYQNGQYICRCEPIISYNTAKAEWTEADEQAYAHQNKYVSQFDRMAKLGKQELASAIVIQNETLDQATMQEAVIIPDRKAPVDNMEDLINDYDPEEWIRKSNENL